MGLRRFDTPHLIEPDRETAIRRAISEAEPGDIVLIAGKGHEPYQVLKDRTIDFDDREVARNILSELRLSERSLDENPVSTTWRVAMGAVGFIPASCSMCHGLECRHAHAAAGRSLLRIARSEPRRPRSRRRGV